MDTSGASPSKSSSMEFEFAPDWRYLRQLRVLVGQFVTVGTDDADLAARVSMAATELTENAVKYAASNSSVIRLRLGPAGQVRIESENEASAERIAELVRLMEQIQQGDPMDAYARALLAAAEGEDMASKVGLARIRCEGRLELSCEIKDRRVRVVAQSGGATAPS